MSRRTSRTATRPARRGHRRLPRGRRAPARPPDRDELLAAPPRPGRRAGGVLRRPRPDRPAGRRRGPTPAGRDADAPALAAPAAPTAGRGPLLRRLRAARGDRPRRHGRRLPGPAGQPQPRRRPEDDPGRPARRRRPTCSGSAPRPRRSANLDHPQHRADLRGRRARRPALLQHEAGRRAAAWPSSSADCRATPRAAAAAGGRRSPGPSITPTSAASCTAT